MLSGDQSPEINFIFMAEHCDKIRTRELSTMLNCTIEKRRRYFVANKIWNVESF